MLTISRLASYAGVTVAAVRHYHKIGLLPEPERDRSGYRMYDAEAVVRLIRIRVLADAGVPLARVESLLDAGEEELSAAVAEIDRRLRTEVRRLQDTRGRLAGLAAGEQMTLPSSVVGYIERLRGLGVGEHYLGMEVDAWIMVAAQLPDRIESIIAQKHDDLEDPDLVEFYLIVGTALDHAEDDPRIAEAADLLDRVLTRAADSGRLNQDGFDDGFAELLDTTMLKSSPAAKQLLRLLGERGWSGWTRLERTDSPRDDAGTTR